VGVQCRMDLCRGHSIVDTALGYPLENSDIRSVLQAAQRHEAERRLILKESF